MADPKEEIVSTLKDCAVAMAVFNLHPDTNVRLTNLQHLNKAYSSMQHRIDKKQIAVGDLDAVLETARAAITEAAENVEVKPDVRERIAKVAPNNLASIVDNLKKNNVMEINTKIVFKQEEKPNVD